MCAPCARALLPQHEGTLSGKVSTTSASNREVGARRPTCTSETNSPVSPAAGHWVKIVRDLIVRDLIPTGTEDMHMRQTSSTGEGGGDSTCGGLFGVAGGDLEGKSRS